MNVIVLILLVALTAGVGLGILVQIDPGYVRVSWMNWLVETNIWIGFILLFAFYFVWHYALRVLARILKTPAGFLDWRSSGSQHRANRRTTRGLLAYAEGNWKKAQRYLSAGAEKSDTPLINYLAAAQAANEQGNEKESDQLLQQAIESTPGSEVAVGVTQAQLQIARDQYEQSLATLLRLRKRDPHHPFVLKLMQQVYLSLSDWNELSVLIPELRKYAVLKESEIAQVERETWLNLLCLAGNEVVKQPREERNTEKLAAVWDRLPTDMRRNDEVIYAYAEQLIRLGEENHAEALLRKVLRNHWSDLLVALYGRICGKNVTEQLSHAENWLKQRPGNATLLLALGRLCLRNELWGKARDYLEASLKLRKSSETYAELGRLLAHLGDHVASSDYFMMGLMGNADLPELPMPMPKRQSA